MTERELTDYIRVNYPRENENCEWKEFKNLKNDFNGHEKNDVISYVSALSNMEGGDLVIGVKDKSLEIVGIDTYNYDRDKARLRLNEFCTNLPTEGLTVEEFVTSDTRKTVWIIHVPKHMRRRPVYAHSKGWQRIDDSLVELTDSRRDSILEEVEVSSDWTAQVVENATLDDIDPQAILLAREGYKQRYPKFAEECDKWTDQVFLDKSGLTIGGKITRTTLLLAGREESAHKLNHIAQIVWKCFQDGQTFGDIYTVPFVKTTSELLGRIRNYRFKIYPKNSLIPAEVWKYDTESILEGLHNAIAHQKYEDGSRIIVTEDKDKLTFQNDGSFYDGDYKQYITGEKTPKRYRNPALVKAMVNIKMIDTQGYGIHKMFQSQKDRFLPMPDYDKSTDNEVVLTLPGSVIDENYSLVLLANQELSLTDVVLLDNVQKGEKITMEAASMLRKRNLIEGRMPHIYVSKQIAQATDQKIDYTKHKGLDEKKCEILLMDALRDHGSLTKSEIKSLLWNILPDQLDDKQKEYKINNILRKLRVKDLIENRTTAGNKSTWGLVNRL
ncbi:MAG: putative DNA binding domain-containing protein [Bacteroidia bacterium]|nr:putative DNA binding domain-containing protein [Bacteroidia bacterium]